MKFTPRYELVFALDQRAADALSDSAAKLMAIDATNVSICDRYYESTPAECGSESKTARRQYRVRRIGDTSSRFLESLNWKRDKYSLRQTVVASSDLGHLHSRVIDKSWAGKWFQKKIIQRSLTPSLQLRFDRAAITAMSPDGAIHLTVDRKHQVNRLRTRDFDLSIENDPKTFTADHPNIVRMNFSVSLPSVFKSLIYQFALLPEQPTAPLEISRAHATNEIESGVGANHVSAPVVISANQETASCQLG